MLNYSTHAIESLLAKRQRMRGAQDKAGLDAFVNSVRDAHKFEMPDRGRIIYGLGDMPEGLVMGRLPFPEIALEIPYSEEPARGKDTIAATRRLVLAREIVRISSEDEPRAASYLERPTHVRIDVAYLNDEDDEWYLQPVGALVEMGASTGRPQHSSDEDPFADNRYKGAAFPLMACPTLPITAEKVFFENGPEWYSHMVSNDVGSEVCILGELLAVLACVNVTMERREAPPKLVRKRLKNSREPFYDVHLLVLAGRAVSTGGGVHVEGEDGYKVREHVRRGHIRRLSDGRSVWINHTLVAAGSKAGRSNKTYSMGRQ